MVPTGTLLPVLPCQNTSPVISKSDPNARRVCIPDSPSLHLLGDHFEKAAAQPGCWDGESVVGSDRMPGSGNKGSQVSTSTPTSLPPPALPHLQCIAELLFPLQIRHVLQG